MCSKIQHLNRENALVEKEIKYISITKRTNFQSVEWETATLAETRLWHTAGADPFTPLQHPQVSGTQMVFKAGWGGWECENTHVLYRICRYFLGLNW